jgi:cytoskeletal protein RodZ
LTTFFAELKQARESHKMSLTDIADTTLINVRFLEALERGDTDILPEAYVRAFIREYAAAVGLDPAETIRSFDAARSPKAAGIQHVPSPPSPPPRPPHPMESAKLPALKILLDTPGAARIAGVAVGIVAIALLAWNLTGSNRGNEVKEIPFQTVMREQEQRLPPPPAVTAPAAPLDSLTLRATAIDTVWMTVAVDSTAPREYLFRPGARALWKARDRFTLTLGNGAAVQFTLNGTAIGVLGKRGSVLRNVPLSRATLGAR